jgi:hypothetical protein
LWIFWKPNRFISNFNEFKVHSTMRPINIFRPSRTKSIELSLGTYSDLDVTYTSFHLSMIPNFVTPSGSLQHFQPPPIRSWLSVSDIIGVSSFFLHFAVIFSVNNTLIRVWHCLLQWSTETQLVCFSLRLLLWDFGYADIWWELIITSLFKIQISFCPFIPNLSNCEASVPIDDPKWNLQGRCVHFITITKLPRTSWINFSESFGFSDLQWGLKDGSC